MKVPRAFFVLCACSGLLSCSKDAIPTVEPEPAPEKIVQEPAADYLMLKTGNFWVYESFSVEPASGQARPLHKRDSLHVSRDTTINRARYHLLEGTRLGEPYSALLRTSGPELLDAEGRVLFSTTSLGDTTELPYALLPGGVFSARSLIQRAEGIDVPYGAFDEALVQHFFLKLAPGPAGLPDNSLRHDAAFYVKGLGLAKFSSQTVGEPICIEMRLVNCRVQ